LRKVLRKERKGKYLIINTLRSLRKTLHFFAVKIPFKTAPRLKNNEIYSV